MRYGRKRTEPAEDEEVVRDRLVKERRQRDAGVNKRFTGMYGA